MSASKSEVAFRRFYDEAFSKGRLSVLDELVSKQFVEHEPPPPGFKTGVEGMKQLFNEMRPASPTSRSP